MIPILITAAFLLFVGFLSVVAITLGQGQKIEDQIKRQFREGKKPDGLKHLVGMLSEMEEEDE